MVFWAQMPSKILRSRLSIPRFYMQRRLGGSLRVSVQSAWKALQRLVRSALVTRNVLKRVSADGPELYALANQITPYCHSMSGKIPFTPSFSRRVQGERAEPVARLEKGKRKDHLAIFLALRAAMCLLSVWLWLPAKNTLVWGTPVKLRLDALERCSGVCQSSHFGDPDHPLRHPFCP